MRTLLVVIAVLGLAALEPALAGVTDAAKAAARAERASQWAKEALDAAKAALKSAEVDAINDGVLKDTNAWPHAQNAVLTADEAVTQALEAVGHAERASQLARKAQAAQQVGDTDKAKQLADQALTAEGDAIAARDKAQKAKAATEANAGLAVTEARNPPGPAAPNDAQKQHWENEKKNIAEQREQNAQRRREMGEAEKQNRATKELLDRHNDEEGDHAQERQPDETPLRWDWTEHDYFKVPELEGQKWEILELPLIKGKANDQSSLRLQLFNDNLFAVRVIGVQGLFFGDAIGFVSPIQDQLIPSLGSLDVLLGEVSFPSPPGSFTAAFFSVDTAPEHPGLGPNFMVNFTGVPLPPSWLLLLAGLAAMALAAGQERCRFPRPQTTWN